MGLNVYCCFNYQNVQRLESIQRNEGDFFYFLTLRGAVKYFHLSYNSRLPHEQWGREICKFEEKLDGHLHWKLNCEVSLLICCRFGAF